MEHELRKESFSPISLRPTVITVSLSALERNYRHIEKKVAPAQVIPIVKANAYGHGLFECARCLEQSGARRLGVAFVEEGIELRQKGISCDILVLGGVFDSQIRYYLDYDLEIGACSISRLESVDLLSKELGKKAKVHLKVDTGMERIGVRYYFAEQLFDSALKLENVEICGLFSHLATSASSEHDFAKTQLERFKVSEEQLRSRCRALGRKDDFLVHIANSGGILMHPSSYHLAVRAGIALYGVPPSGDCQLDYEMQPVLSLKSKVVFFKIVRKGAGVGYDLTYTADSDIRVVTVPIGYGDGYPRSLSNTGFVLIKGKRYPVIGSVCMDQIMVNVFNDEVYPGEEVVLVGEQREEKISMMDLSNWSGRSQYEIMAGLNMRIPRVYV